MQIHQYNPNRDIFNEFDVECEKCCGLCCVALFFSKFDGFPSDKAAGIPCENLNHDNFRCTIHRELNQRHMKGCLAYDCFGAGQIVASLFERQNWKSNPQEAQEMFDIFIKVFQLQQMLWYLAEAATLIPAKELWAEVEIYIEKIHFLIQSTPQYILNFNVEEIRGPINLLLRSAGTLVKNKTCHSNKVMKKKEYMGYNFNKAQLDGCDFSSILLIAANLNNCSLNGCSFLGTDLRDASIKSADLKESIFLTQGQLNSAKGNKDTHIPAHLNRPVTWE